MAKKAFGRKKGIERGISKHRVRRKETVDGQERENGETKCPKFLGIRRSKLSSFGDKCFDFCLFWCEKLYLIGFRRTQSGQYVLLDPKARLLHYAVIFCLMALFVQRSWGTVEMFMYEEIRMQSVMALSMVTTYFVAVCVTVGILMKPKETIDLLNSWPHISASLKMIDPSSEFHPFDNISATLKIVSGFILSQGIVFAIGFASVFIEGLPVFIYSTAERNGLIPEDLPQLGWKFMFMPLEWLAIWPFMVAGVVAGSCLILEIGALDEYLQRLRSIDIRSMKSRQRVEQMYVQLQLFNRINQVWIRHYLPPGLVGLSSGVIVAAFVTIRYTEVPFLVYIIFPDVTVTLTFIIFWESYDVLRVIRVSEDILDGLLQHHAPYFQRMTRQERVEKMKRSRAMRKLIFPLGDSEFSVGVPISTWDEIINQILFLLSL